jgi:hypothetical protein
MAQEETYDLTIGDDIKALELGITKICVTQDLKIICIYYGKDEAIECPYNKSLKKTVDDVKQTLINSHQFDDKLSQLKEFATLLTEPIREFKEKLRQQEQSSKESKKSEYEKAMMTKISKCKADIEYARNLNIGISSEAWRDGLTHRYNGLRDAVNANIPEIWQGLEFALSSHRILNIHGCTLPFIGIVLARPGTYKTVTLSLIELWYCTFYTDSFSPKSWITHTTAKDSEEELGKLDMLPKIKDRLFLTPELAPLFTMDEKDLGLVWGTITRIADGHGLATDSGAWGHRHVLVVMRI